MVRVELSSQLKGESDPGLARVIEQIIRRGGAERIFNISWHGVSSFARRILQRCGQIGFGEVMSYGELAEAAGVSNGARAVGQVMAHNRFPLLFPCHRVVAADGRLGGFTGGLEIKKRLLKFEGWVISGSGWKARILR